MSDDREIKHIEIDYNGNPHVFQVGCHGVTQILEYQENGVYCHIPFLRVLDGEKTVLEAPKCKANAIFFEEVSRVVRAVDKNDF
ncbi:MAG: hypothetical protein AAF438_14575 [Pseudomonadota bacterium]